MQIMRVIKELEKFRHGTLYVNSISAKNVRYVTAVGEEKNNTIH
jgi:hypothetical protein